MNAQCLAGESSTKKVTFGTRTVTYLQHVSTCSTLLQATNMESLFRTDTMLGRILCTTSLGESPQGH